MDWASAVRSAELRVSRRARRRRAQVQEAAIAILWDTLRSGDALEYNRYIDTWQSTIRQYCTMRRMGIPSAEAWDTARPVTASVHLEDLGDFGNTLLEVGDAAAP